MEKCVQCNVDVDMNYIEIYNDGVFCLECWHDKQDIDLDLDSEWGNQYDGRITED